MVTENGADLAADKESKDHEQERKMKAKRTNQVSFSDRDPKTAVQSPVDATWSVGPSMCATTATDPDIATVSCRIKMLNKSERRHCVLPMSILN